MICSTLECYSEAITESKISGDNYCVECSIKVVKANGPLSLVPLPDYKLPWEAPIADTCHHCGNGYNKYLIGMGWECPVCRRDLPLYKTKDQK